MRDKPCVDKDCPRYGTLHYCYPPHRGEHADRRTHIPFDNRGEQHRRYRSTDLRRPRITPFRVLVALLVLVALATLWHTQQRCVAINGAHSILCTD